MADLFLSQRFWVDFAYTFIPIFVAMDIPGLVPVSINPTPVGYTVGTNVAKGWLGSNGFDLICGLQALNPGTADHGWLAVVWCLVIIALAIPYAAYLFRTHVSR